MSRAAPGEAMTNIESPFDAFNTEGLSAQEIAALNEEFRRLWPAWRVRAPKQIGDEEVARLLCEHIFRRYFGT